MPSKTHSTLDSGPSTQPSDDEVLVRVEGVSKKFCRSLKKSLWYGVCDIAGELLPGRKRRETRDEGRELPDRSAQDISRSPLDTGLSTSSASALDARPSTLDSSSGLRAGEFWAVKDVSFELRRGECLGLIGHNGAGKTTLLKMLNGLIKPDRGTITMRGRVGALIALGAGFNPILTGRENIYINGSVLGFAKKEIDEKIDEIIDFAEIREFIDMPVQSYSSGMAVRLGFSVASSMSPDVLILDEVLAVGDAAFRAKCMIRISEVLRNAAVIFVSHQNSLVQRICDKAVWLEKGMVKFIGPTIDVLPLYSKKISNSPDVKPSEYQSGDAITLLGATCQSQIISGDDLKIKMHLLTRKDMQYDSILIGINDNSMNLVAQSKFQCSGVLKKSSTPNEITINLHKLCLNSGAYHININFSINNGKIILYRLENACYFSSMSEIEGYVAYQPKGEII